MRSLVLNHRSTLRVDDNDNQASDTGGTVTKNLQQLQAPTWTLGIILLAIVALWPSGGLYADTLTGSDRFLCAAVETTQCYAEGDCLSEPPWQFNIPQFIEVDLATKTLSTTEASGENRSTPIKNLEREDGYIYLQGIERQRAFSFVIAEEDGFASIAVARDGLVVSVFANCTPIQGE